MKKEIQFDGLNQADIIKFAPAEVKVVNDGVVVGKTRVCKGDWVVKDEDGFKVVKDDVHGAKSKK